jgi:hypothetical protein
VWTALVAAQGHSSSLCCGRCTVSGSSSPSATVTTPGIG